MPTALRSLAAVLVLAGPLGCSQSFKGRCQSDADCGYGQVCDGSSGERLCKAACGDLACTKVSIRSVAVTDAAAATNGYYAADGGVPVPVSVVVVDGVGAPAVGAELAVNGTTLAALGPPALAGPTRTYAFQVPSSLGVPGTEAPLGFTVTARDAAGNPVVAAIPGRLKIDDLGPAATSLAVRTSPEFIDASGVKWFRQSLGGSVEVTASVTDAGSGVNPSSLRLVLQSDAATRVDSGAAAGPDAGTTTYHFLIPRLGAGPGQIAAGSQGVVRFQVAGADNLGHPLHLTAAGQIGIDGQAPPAPALDLTAQYPAAKAGCDAAALCGHDGAHFWRLGDDGKLLTFTASDGTGGSGLSLAAGATCDFGAGQPACAVQWPGTAGGGGSVAYQFAVNPSQLALNTDAAGNGQVAATVAVRDAVGNLSASSSAPISITRVKWIKQFGPALSSLNTAPILTPPIGVTNPQRQLIIAGAGASNDSIYSMAIDGAVIGSAGRATFPAIASVSSPMAFSAITNRLYVLTNSSSVYVFTVTSAGPGPTPYVCSLGSGSSTGAPALLGADAAAEVALVADNASNRLQVISGNMSCSTVTNILISNAGNVLGTPTTDGAAAGASIFIPSGGSDIAKVIWDSGSKTLSTAAHASINVAKTIAPIAIAGDLFFADNRGPQYHRYAAAFSSVWDSSGGMMDPLSSIAAGSGPVVNDGLVFGFADSQNGPLRAFYASTTGANMAGSLAFAYPSLSAVAGRVSPVAVTAQRTVYFTDSGNRELVALQYASGATTASPVVKWKFQGESAFLGGADTRFTGGGAEPVIGADGTLYFVDGSSVYAILTDTGPGATPTAGVNWPRVAFDNCNSGNSSYTNCQ